MGSSNSLRNPSNGKTGLTCKISNAHNFGHEAKYNFPCMEKLSYIVNSEYEVNKPFFDDHVRYTQKKTKILKNIELDHIRACDKPAVTIVNVTKHGFGIRICLNICPKHAITA